MVSASLASVWNAALLAVDLDVEEPNLHLFLRPQLNEPRKAWIEVPVLDRDRCTLCRKCADLCQFKAISVMLSTLNIYPEMCHGCGGCLAVCPEKALSAGLRELGEIRVGRAGEVDFLMGTLRIGEAMSPPFMEQVKETMRKMIRPTGQDVIIDAPPGVSCPAICSVIDSDVIVLVTDQTPFGLHDFRLAWQSFSPLGKPMGAVINRAGLGPDDIYDFCTEKRIPILARIPYDREIAEAYSRGRVIARISPELESLFIGLADRIHALAGDSPAEINNA